MNKIQAAIWLAVAGISTWNLRTSLQARDANDAIVRLTQQRVDIELRRAEATAAANATLAEMRWSEFQAFRRWMDRHDAIDLVDRICWEEGP